MREIVEAIGREPFPAEQEVFDSAPPLDAVMMLCINAWETLSTCRAIGMAVGPIPYSPAFRDWAEDEGLDREAKKIVWGVIRKLDSDRAAREAEKAKAR